MRFFIKNKETTSFKKRYFIGYNLPKLIFGDFSLTLTKSTNIEYIYLFNFKRSIKKYFLKKNQKKKIWLFLHKNYPLTKKSKNARMGKGKGTPLRFCSKTLQNHNIFEFSGFNLKHLNVLKKIFKKKVNLPTTILCSFFKNKYYNHSNGNENNFYFKKYKN